MIVELVLRELSNLELEGYEKIKVPVGILFANPIEKRIEVVVKNILPFFFRKPRLLRRG